MKERFFISRKFQNISIPLSNHFWQRCRLFEIEIERCFAMREIIITAKNREEAIKKALKELQVTEKDISIEEEEVGELISDRMDVPEKHFRVTVRPERISEEATRILYNLLTKIGLKPEIRTTVKDDIIYIKINTDDNALLIGRRGKNLEAIQHLINRMIFRNKNGTNVPLIVLDTENYYGKKIKRLEEIAFRAAKKALRTKKDIALKPMTPDERKIIHTVLRGFNGVKTYSIGAGDDRHVIISPESRL